MTPHQQAQKQCGIRCESHGSRPRDAICDPDVFLTRVVVWSPPPGGREFLRSDLWTCLKCARSFQGLYQFASYYPSCMCDINNFDPVWRVTVRFPWWSPLLGHLTQGQTVTEFQVPVSSRHRSKLQFQVVSLVLECLIYCGAQSRGPHVDFDRSVLMFSVLEPRCDLQATTVHLFPNCRSEFYNRSEKLDL